MNYYLEHVQGKRRYFNNLKKASLNQLRIQVTLLSQIIYQRRCSNRQIWLYSYIR